MNKSKEERNALSTLPNPRLSFSSASANKGRKKETKTERNELKKDRKKELGWQAVQPCFSADEVFCNPSCEH